MSNQKEKSVIFGSSVCKFNNFGFLREDSGRYPGCISRRWKSFWGFVALMNSQDQVEF